MCGISGLGTRPGERPEEAVLRGMAGAMRRRGPDAEGFFSEGSIGLSHRRLKIIDLSDAANQPLFNETGRVGVVFNGEIYNFLALRAELERAGHRFVTRSDTEVIVHAYEEWGTDSFRRFNGIFALAIWDGRHGSRLVLARDRFGVKPLFYAHKEGRLAFASELKPLLTLPWISRTISPETLFHFLKFSHVPSPRSILEDVQQLPPGSWLAWSPGKELERGAFWNPTELTGHEIAMTEADALAEAERLLTQAVERQLVSDVPVGLFLSGGIDSSLLAAAYEGLRHKGAPPIRSFSIGYVEREFDESSHARRMAEAFGTDHREWIVKPSDLFGVIPDVPDYFDQPFADPTLLSTLLLARFARQEVTVALSGDGGDELFFGYPHERALLFFSRLGAIPRGPREAVLDALRSAAGALLRGPARKQGHRLEKLSGMLRFGTEAELFQYFIGTLGPLPIDQLAALVPALADRGAPPESALAPLMGELAGLPLDQRITQVFLRTFMVDTVLAKTDRASMAFGLEARVPFLDDDLAEFSARLPFRLKASTLRSKRLLRSLLARKLSEKGLDPVDSRRPKQGFSIPLRDWLRGELQYLLDEYLNPSRLKREGLLDGQGVARLVHEHLQTGANHSHLLWSLVSFQMWKERYLP